MPFLVLFIFCGVCAIVIFFNQKSGVQGSWVQFFAKGTDAGFSIKEIELLRKLATMCSLGDPASLFWSQNQLDQCIRTLVKIQRNGSPGEDLGDEDFLSRLYEYRKKIEMEKPRIKNGISNSRQISEGQNLRILVPGSGVFRSQVIRNGPQNITISRPVNDKVSSNFAWTGTKMSVYFWRPDDAGYVFDTEAVDEVLSKGISSLKISHSDSLYRTQKRRSIRMKMHKPAYLYLIKPEEGPGKVETVPGARCFMEDLSDTGCALIIGGQAAAGMRIKVQFALNGVPICMGGTVRSVDYKEAAQRSLLHVESDPLPLYAQNKILGEIFGMEDSEDDLPYRLSGEAEETASVPAEVMETVLGPSGSGGPDQFPGSAAFVPAEPSSPPVFTPGPQEEDPAAETAVPPETAPDAEPPLMPFPPEGGIL
ncbi:MAG: PilZ domain-containing protein [Treponema sp.]|jgi:c-di-GMP-binding flagellar brake protein YcgR|nr:PilZ domain-containing protein [Treponema sp.]